jgi:hypothetical protein
MISRDIERSHLSLMLHTLVLPSVVRGQRSDVGSEKHAKNFYVFILRNKIFISIFVNLNGFRANRYE